MSAYDAEQTEIGSPQQTIYNVVFGARKVNRTRTGVHQVQIQIKMNKRINTMIISHIIC